MGTAARPTYRDLRRRIASLMLERGEWAGAPVPVEGLSLQIEPSYPYQGLSTRIADRDDTPDDSPLDANGLMPGETFVNAWYCQRRESYVYVIRSAEGRSIHYTLPEKRYVRRLTLQLESMRACWAHDIEAEEAAMATLALHCSAEQFTQYTLLGQLIETSKRSKVTYLFRRAKPTIALRATADGSRVIAVLCLHPIAYYRETFVGAMTPTDDVIAHLLMMRGDEPMFWRRCNQHSPEAAEACL